MDKDNKTTTGAPSSDTTSALFVSARKKQLEQQEAERRAKEKEEQRLAAEAEVRRLEAEVEERRRKAEEDAWRAEAEAEQRRRQAEEDARRAEADAEHRKRLADEETRRIAEEARLMKAQAAQDPDSILGAPMQGREHISPNTPTPQLQQSRDMHPNTTHGPNIRQPINKKLLLIGGGAIGVIALVIILIATLSGGNGGYSGGSIDVPVPSQQPSPVPAASIDITAEYFYLRGDEDGDSVWFYSNGTMEIFYSASEQTHTHDYTIDGDTISVHGSLYNNPAPFIFAIVSESLLIDQDGDHFISLDFGGQRTTEWTLDPFAYMDTFVGIELLMIDIPFPGSELYLKSRFPDSITLSSMDDTATINFQTLYEFDWLHTEDALVEVKEDLLGYMIDVLPGDIAILDYGINNEPNNYYAYFELLYESDGEHRFTHLSVGALLNLPVGGQWYYAIGVDCLSEQIEEYMQLLNNIRYEMMRQYLS